MFANVELWEGKSTRFLLYRLALALALTYLNGVDICPADLYMVVLLPRYTDIIGLSQHR